MTELEFDILDEIYFVTGYQEVREQLMVEEEALQQGFRSLLQQGYVQQLYFDEGVQDYVKQNAPDLDHIAKYHYLATKEGLLAHNL